MIARVRSLLGISLYPWVIPILSSLKADINYFIKHLPKFTVQIPFKDISCFVSNKEHLQDIHHPLICFKEFKYLHLLMGNIKMNPYLKHFSLKKRLKQSIVPNDYIK